MATTPPAKRQGAGDADFRVHGSSSGGRKANAAGAHAPPSLLAGTVDLGARAMKWVQFHRDLHAHPFVAPAGGLGVYVVCVLGLIAGKDYGTTGFIPPPWCTPEGVATFGSITTAMARDALTKLLEAGAITGDTNLGIQLERSVLSLLFAERLRDRERKASSLPRRQFSSPLLSSTTESTESEESREHRRSGKDGNAGNVDGWGDGEGLRPGDIPL